MKSIRARLVSMFALVALVSTPCASATCYPRTFTVEAVNPNTNEVTFSDMEGEQWKWFTEEEWLLDDMAAAIMDDNGTPTNLYDDRIITVVYQTNIADWGEPDEVWEED